MSDGPLQRTPEQPRELVVIDIAAASAPNTYAMHAAHKEGATQSPATNESQTQPQSQTDHEPADAHIVPMTEPRAPYIPDIPVPAMVLRGAGHQIDRRAWLEVLDPRHALAPSRIALFN